MPIGVNRGDALPGLVECRRSNVPLGVNCLGLPAIPVKDRSGGVAKLVNLLDRVSRGIEDRCRDRPGWIGHGHLLTCHIICITGDASIRVDAGDGLPRLVEWLAMAERLKQTPCPHCKVVGTLNRHGSLLGYDESSPQQRTVRARRVFCSNRNARRGCGRTFSVWFADKIRRLSLTAGALWRFLQAAVAGSNRQFTHWVENDYNTLPHDAIGMKPIDRFGIDLARLRFLPPSEHNDELFYAEADRKVKKDNTFSFSGRRYETSVDLRDQKIQLRFDRRRLNSTAVIIYHKGQRMGAARLLDAVANGLQRRKEQS